MPDPTFQIPPYFDYGATFLWALSGALLAARKGYAIPGILTVGGGRGHRWVAGGSAVPGGRHGGRKARASLHHRLQCVAGEPGGGGTALLHRLAAKHQALGPLAQPARQSLRAPLVISLGNPTRRPLESATGERLEPLTDPTNAAPERLARETGVNGHGG